MHDERTAGAVLFSYAQSGSRTVAYDKGEAGTSRREEMWIL